MDKEVKCPVIGSSGAKGAVGLIANKRWWPDQVNLNILSQNKPAFGPLGKDFDYAAEFEKLDLFAVKKDIFNLMTNSQDWWPADYGHYGPFFIRMAWHSAGTYRIGDGRGGAGAGTLRFAPLNSWPDNGNLDKARRLLWPVKKKYGRKISWADLMILTGNCALESMGLETFGFSGGREDVWEPEEDIYWGPETEWLDDKRYSGVRELEQPLGAVQMGLIYVNPEGPNGNPDPLASAIDIRETFRRMAMNDEETVALIAGGHTFGKAHGAADPDKYVGPEPEAASLEEQGTGWKNSFGSGRGADTITSGLEGAWTTDPIVWDNNYFENLFEYEWEKSSSPAGAVQWIPKNKALADAVPDAHESSKRHAPIMLTTDLALKEDPIYRGIAKRFYNNPDQFSDSFSRAWYKLTHRDLGPYSRCLGPLVPKEPQLWQDPIPTLDHKVIGQEEIDELKEKLWGEGLTISQLVKTAWASASTFRGTDNRGGANGCRVRLEPQRQWEANEPKELSSILIVLEKIRDDFNYSRTDGRRVSLADLVVLGGCAAVERAALNGGISLRVNFNPGRMDASAEQTDEESFSVLEPKSDGFRNYHQPGSERSAEELLLDKAQMLKLSASEMTVLLGGMRTLNAVVSDSKVGVLTENPETLTNDFFINLLDLNISWTASKKSRGVYNGVDIETGKLMWMASAVDLLFGSNSQLRAISEVFASDDAKESFAVKFAAVWSKVMDLDRFELQR